MGLRCRPVVVVVVVTNMPPLFKLIPTLVTKSPRPHVTFNRTLVFVLSPSHQTLNFESHVLPQSAVPTIRLFAGAVQESEPPAAVVACADVDCLGIVAPPAGVVVCADVDCLGVVADIVETNKQVDTLDYIPAKVYRGCEFH